MEETIVKLSTAKLAQKLGFDEETKYKQTDLYDDYIEYPEYECDSEDDFCREDYTKDLAIWDNALPIPTQALLQKWLREKFEYIVYVTPIWTFSEKIYYVAEVLHDGTTFEPNQAANHQDTYEKVLEFALKETLKKILDEETIQKEKETN